MRAFDDKHDMQDDSTLPRLPGPHETASDELDVAWRKELQNLMQQYEQARRRALQQTLPESDPSAESVKS